MTTKNNVIKKYELPRPIRTNYSHTRNPELSRYNFQRGMPDLRLFPIDEFRSHLNDGLKRRLIPEAFWVPYPRPRVNRSFNFF